MGTVTDFGIGGYGRVWGVWGEGGMMATNKRQQRWLGTFLALMLSQNSPVKSKNIILNTVHEICAAVKKTGRFNLVISA